MGRDLDADFTRRSCFVQGGLHFQAHRGVRCRTGKIAHRDQNRVGAAGIDVDILRPDFFNGQSCGNRFQDWRADQNGRIIQLLQRPGLVDIIWVAGSWWSGRFLDFGGGNRGFGSGRAFHLRGRLFHNKSPRDRELICPQRLRQDDGMCQHRPSIRCCIQFGRGDRIRQPHGVGVTKFNAQLQRAGVELRRGIQPEWQRHPVQSRRGIRPLEWERDRPVLFLNVHGSAGSARRPGIGHEGDSTHRRSLEFDGARKSGGCCENQTRPHGRREPRANRNHNISLWKSSHLYFCCGRLKYALSDSFT